MMAAKFTAGAFVGGKPLAARSAQDCHQQCRAAAHRQDDGGKVPAVVAACYCPHKLEIGAAHIRFPSGRVSVPS